MRIGQDMMHSQRHRQGFSLSELLVVMAIITALASIALPLFLDQYHAWQKHADEQVARDACAAATQAYLYESAGSSSNTAVTYYYNEATGEVSTSRDGISSYGRYDGEADYTVSGVTVTGNAAQEGLVSVAFGSAGTIGAVAWGDAIVGPGFEYAITGTNNWWHWAPDSNRENSINRLYAVDNEERKQHDIAVLQAIADYFEGLDAETAHTVVGDYRWSHSFGGGKGGNSVLLDYGQDKGGGSIRIANMEGATGEMLENVLGYHANVYNSTRRSVGDYAAGFNYVDRYLFTSNEMLGDHYLSDVHHQVWIEFKVVNGTVTNVHVWVNGGLTSQGFDVRGS